MKFIEDYQRVKSQTVNFRLLWWMLDQSFWVTLSYRVLSWLYATPMWWLAKILEKFVEFVFKCYLPSGVKIGGGLVVFHAFCIIINGNCTIGKNCTLYARVCLGSRWPGDEVPIIGDNVVLGTGACIFGPVSVPDGAVVPANSVITPKNAKFSMR